MEKDGTCPFPSADSWQGEDEDSGRVTMSSARHFVPLIMGWKFSTTSETSEQPLPAGFGRNISGQLPALGSVLGLCVKITSSPTKTRPFDLIVRNQEPECALLCPSSPVCHNSMWIPNLLLVCPVSAVPCNYGIINLTHT